MKKFIVILLTVLCLGISQSCVDSNEEDTELLLLLLVASQTK